MPEPTALLSFLLVAIALWAMPGPAQALLVSRSLGDGRRAALMTMVGASFGHLGYTLATAFGLANVMDAAPQAIDLLRVVGAAYLLWLAIRTARGPRPMRAAAGAGTDAPAWQLVATGCLAIALSPKVALFYLAVLPSFLDAASDTVVQQVIVFGTVQAITSTVGNLGLVLVTHRLGGWSGGNVAASAARRWTVSAGLGVVAVGLLSEFSG
jgi:threonine/homoserine/homoserine lactone efflux protein